jgi:hypothetical protein
MAKASNAWLRRQYLRFNKEYFGNQLSKKTLVRFGRSKYLGETGTGDCSCGMAHEPDILLNWRTKWSKSLTAPTLLHEMVHVEHPTWSHGWRFTHRMRDLISQGALDEWL